jgi:cytosine deaminase
MTDGELMDLAYAQARKSFDEGGVPVGAVLAEGGRVLGAGHNRREQQGDPIAHGEMDCLRTVGRRKSYRSTVLYTTLCPCMMCAGTVVQFKIPRVVIGDDENFGGSIPFLRSHGVEVEVLSHRGCIELMKHFIATRPDLWNEDIAEE